MTFDATVNPVVYEGGVPVFIDTEYILVNNVETIFIQHRLKLYFII